MKQNSTIPKLTAIMPVYIQTIFIRCVMRSLLAQTFKEWELHIVDDGSTDNLQATVADYLKLAHVHYFRFDRNTGLGTCLNLGLKHDKGNFITYLPADDIYYCHHLQTMIDAQKKKNADMVVAGMVYIPTDNTGGEGRVKQTVQQIEGGWLQPVQVMYRKTNDRWMERTELVTDDYGRMFWQKFKKKNLVVAYTNFQCLLKKTTVWKKTRSFFHAFTGVW